MRMTHRDASEKHLCVCHVSVIATEALFWEVHLSVTLFLSLSFLSFFVSTN